MTDLLLLTFLDFGALLVRLVVDYAIKSQSPSTTFSVNAISLGPSGIGLQWHFKLSWTSPTASIGFVSRPCLFASARSSCHFGELLLSLAFG